MNYLGEGPVSTEDVIRDGKTYRKLSLEYKDKDRKFFRVKRVY